MNARRIVRTSAHESRVFVEIATRYAGYGVGQKLTASSLNPGAQPVEHFQVAVCEPSIALGARTLCTLSV